MSFKLLSSSLTLSYLATISARSWASLIAASCSASAPVENESSPVQVLSELQLNTWKTNFNFTETTRMGKCQNNCIKAKYDLGA